jgi:hypothetical protein
LEEKRVFKKALEGLGQCDGKTSLTLVTRILLQLLEKLADFLPLTRILLFGFFRGYVLQSSIDLLQSSLQMENISGISMEYVGLPWNISS